MTAMMARAPESMTQPLATSDRTTEMHSASDPSSLEGTLTEESLAADLEAFIRDRFRVAPDDTQFGPDADLWEEGYVDSAGVVEVLAFLESKAGFRLPEELLFDPDFVTISGMARLVHQETL